MSAQVRTAQAGDVPAMHRIRLAVRENRLTDASKITEAAYYPHVQARSAWVAEDGGRILGFAAIEGPARQVWALFVGPGAEGAGVGRALHDAMLDGARAQGIPELWLTTSEATRAERFYLAAGWEKAGKAEDGDLRLRRSVSVRRSASAAHGAAEDVHGAVEDAAACGPEGVQGAEDDQEHQRQDQAVFDGRSAAFVTPEAGEEASHHRPPPSGG